MGRDYKEEKRPRELGRGKKEAKGIGRDYKEEERPRELGRCKTEARYHRYHRHV